MLLRLSGPQAGSRLYGWPSAGRGGPAWRAAPGTGTPLAFAAQFDFAATPPLDGFPIEGVLQLFAGRDRWEEDWPHALLRLPDGVPLAAPADAVPEVDG